MKTLHLTGNQKPFNLDLTLACGQVFRWTKTDNVWSGVVDQQVVTVKQENDSILYDGISRSDLIQYFSLDISLEDVMLSIRNSIRNYSGNETDSFFEVAAKSGVGLRIIRQDPWESLISFICSQNSNIPSITKRINLLCERYGQPLDNYKFGFPTPFALAECGAEELRICSTGYRASYLTDTASCVINDPTVLSEISSLPLKRAREELMKFPGVGPKVADCVLLFGYSFYESVPVDVWIRSIITRAYPDVQERACGKKDCSYTDIANFCRDYFGSYAGYAQQLLFAARQVLPLSEKSLTK